MALLPEGLNSQSSRRPACRPEFNNRENDEVDEKTVISLFRTRMSFDPRRVDAWQQYVTNVQLRRARTSHWLGHSSIDLPEAVDKRWPQDASTSTSTVDSSRQGSSLIHSSYPADGIGQIGKEQKAPHEEQGAESSSSKTVVVGSESDRVKAPPKAQPASKQQQHAGQRDHSGEDKSASAPAGPDEHSTKKPASKLRKSPGSARHSNAPSRPKNSAVRDETYRARDAHEKPVRSECVSVRLPTLHISAFLRVRQWVCSKRRME